MSDVFSASHFRDDQAAREYLERLRWPAGTVCPHCGVIGHSYKTPTPGRYRCAEKGCRKDFTVTVNTPMERSHIALHKWLQAFALMTASKKGISAHQLHRTLDITYRSAWFMAHRVRECMRTGGLAPLGGEGKIVEADETYIGKIPEAKQPKFKTSGRPFSKSGARTHGHARHTKQTVITLVERGGSVRSFSVPGSHLDEVVGIVRNNIARESRLHTDESKLYHRVGKEFAAHETVTHSRKEYARGDVTTNTVEGYFAIFKRGMKGIYQHCDEKHLHRYLAEYDFRYNTRTALGYNDGDRAALAIKGADGKRLTYRNANEAKV
jgi:transposase-like protein